MLSKKNEEKAIHLFYIEIKDERGKAKKCEICKKEFSLLVKEHQCKRCKRAVCTSCAHFKAPIYRLKKFQNQPRR